MKTWMSRRRRCAIRTIALSVAVITTLGGANAGAASGPKLTVPKGDLNAAFHCPVDPTDATTTPIMFVTGTGVAGTVAYGLVSGAFDSYGHPVCFVDFPDQTTADIQISVEYLVNGLRREFKMADRKVAVVGISQGGLLSRFALTYWPDLRDKVSDVVSLAGSHHGTTIPFGGDCSTGCAPAVWQQYRGSNLLEALNSQPDETPGAVSYTTVRTVNDDVLQPQRGKHPTSSLEGASNILIQDVCPGRTTTHIGALGDSVSFAALADAVARNGSGKKGAAKASALDVSACDQPYPPGLDETQFALTVATSTPAVILQILNSVPKVAIEPHVRKAFR